MSTQEEERDGLALTAKQRDTLAAAIAMSSTAIELLMQTLEFLVPPDGPPLKLVPKRETPARGTETRAQELAADAMAAKYGRCGVRPLADGAVEITGMLDDIEFETVCIEQDGRERWRRP